ncbi:MAG: Clp protease ClpP [Neobacillus sp.]|jgi:ATP-dependent protease ClpP protease subunit|nr:Clp protease ClpP [Neobacillus sp.]
MPKIPIKGIIVSNDEKWIYDWYEIESVCPKDVEDIIGTANNEKLEVEINSGGGDIFAGSDIYAALKLYKGEVEITVTALAASAASVIAMGGKCRMVPTALMMVHNVSLYGYSGDYHDMDKASEMLKTANQSIANAYISKTGMSSEDALSMMDKETWLTAQQAKEKGLIDEVLFMNNEPNYSFSNSINPMLSKEKIEFAKNEKQKTQLKAQENQQEQLRNQLLEELDLI